MLRIGAAYLFLPVSCGCAFLFIHPRAPNLISLRFSDTTQAGDVSRGPWKKNGACLRSTGACAIKCW